MKKMILTVFLLSNCFLYAATDKTVTGVIRPIVIPPKMTVQSDEVDFIAQSESQTNEMMIHRIDEMIDGERIVTFVQL